MTATCVRCGRPMADQAYVDQHCAQRLAEDLREAGGHAEDAGTVIARQARYGGGSRGGSDEPLPVDLTAAARYAVAENVITTWARHVVEEGGAALPATRPAAGPLCAVECQHVSCRVIRRPPPAVPLATVARWLAGQVGWLRARAEAREAFDELHDACGILRRLVDRPADKELVGVCDCGKVLYAAHGKEFVTCPQPTCRQVWHVERSRDILRRHLDGKLVTAAEAAHLAAYLDSDRTQEQIRKLINKWSQRGLITAHGNAWREPTEVEVAAADAAGEEPGPVAVPTYRFGDVAERLAQTPRRAAAREAVEMGA